VSGGRKGGKKEVTRQEDWGSKREREEHRPTRTSGITRTSEKHAVVPRTKIRKK